MANLKVTEPKPKNINRAPYMDLTNALSFIVLLKIRILLSYIQKTSSLKQNLRTNPMVKAPKLNLLLQLQKDTDSHVFFLAKGMLCVL